VRDPDPKVWKDRARLAELASAAPLEHESLHLLVALGSRLQDDGGDRDAVAFLRRVQRAYPADFFANYMLACALNETGDPWPAVGHFRAALAARPDAANAWYGLGIALHKAGQLDEAEVALRESVRLAPTHGWAHAQLGLVLRKEHKTDEAIDHWRLALRHSSPAAWLHTELARALQDRQRWEEAIDCYREAARLDPDNPWTHYNLGMALNTPGRQDEAIVHLEKAVTLNPGEVEARMNLALALLACNRPADAVAHLREVLVSDPNNTAAQQALRTALLRLGNLEEARTVWKTALESHPTEHDTWFGYPELCLFLDNRDEFRWARSELLAQFRDATDPYVAKRVGRACLLLPGSEDELRQAAVLTERAAAATDPEHEWARPYFLFAKGLADYRLGRFDEAIVAMGGVAKNILYIGPSAGLVTAMALYRKGNTNEARTALAAAVDSYDWSLAKADNHDVWIPHILRREAEAMILAEPPAVREGPHDD
jgi:serine/threonine-protein kinase